MSSTPQEPKKEKIVTIGTLIISCAATGILSMVVSIYLSNLEKVSSETFIGTIATLIGIIVALAIGFQIYNSLDSKRSIEKLIEQVEKKISDYDVEHNRLRDKINNIDLLKNDLKYTINYIEMNLCNKTINMMIASHNGKDGYNRTILEALVAGLKYRLIHSELHLNSSDDIKKDKMVNDCDYYIKLIILIINISTAKKGGIKDLKSVLMTIPTTIDTYKLKEHHLYHNIKLSIEQIENILNKIDEYKYDKELILQDTFISTLFETNRQSIKNE